MKNLIEQLLKVDPDFTQPNLVIHLGAGRCKELSLYRSLSPQSLYLVEANPTIALELQNRISSAKGETVINSIVSGSQDDQITLHLCNNPAEHSILELAGILEYLPNLSVIGEISVKNESLSDLLARCAFDISKKNLLVLETPGCELEILDTLPLDLLHGFMWIAVRVGRKVLHSGGTSFSELSERLITLGYNCQFQNKETVGPYVEVVYRRDEGLARLHLLSNQLQVSQKRSAELELQLAQYNKLVADYAAEKAAHKDLEIRFSNLISEFQELTVTRKSESEALSQYKEQVTILQNQLHLETQERQRLEKIEKENTESLKLLDARLEQSGKQLLRAENELANERKLTEHFRNESSSLQQKLEQVIKKHANDVNEFASSIEQAEQNTTTERCLKEQFRTDSLAYKQQLEQVRIENVQLSIQRDQLLNQLKNFEQTITTLQAERSQKNASLLKADSQIEAIISLLNQS